MRERMIDESSVIPGTDLSSDQRDEREDERARVCKRESAQERERTREREKERGRDRETESVIASERETRERDRASSFGTATCQS